MKFNYVESAKYIILSVLQDGIPTIDVVNSIYEIQNGNKEELKEHIKAIKNIMSKALKEYEELLIIKKKYEKYKEVIDKLKNKTKENIENAKCEITTLTIGDEAYYQYIEKILDNYVDILKEVE